MSGKLLVQRSITTSHVSSATNEEGLDFDIVTPDAGNTGRIVWKLHGTLAAAINYYCILLDDGDVGDVYCKISDDGGSSFEGRRGGRTWQTHNSATLPTSHYGTCSRVIAVDTDSDGTPDALFFACVYRDAGASEDTLGVYKTTDLTGQSGWSELSTPISGDTNLTYTAGLNQYPRAARPGLFFKRGRLVVVRYDDVNSPRARHGDRVAGARAAVHRYHEVRLVKIHAPG